MLQIKALPLCGQISSLDNDNRVKSKNANRNVSIILNFAALDPEVRLRYVNLEVFWMFVLVIREYLRNGSLFGMAFQCFVALGWGGGGGGGGLCINTQVHANRLGSGCHFTKD